MNERDTKDRLVEKLHSVQDDPVRRQPRNTPWSPEANSRMPVPGGKAQEVLWVSAPSVMAWVGSGRDLFREDIDGDLVLRTHSKAPWSLEPTSITITPLLEENGLLSFVGISYNKLPEWRDYVLSKVSLQEPWTQFCPSFREEFIVPLSMFETSKDENVDEVPSLRNLYNVLRGIQSTGDNAISNLITKIRCGLKSPEDVAPYREVLSLLAEVIYPGWTTLTTPYQIEFVVHVYGLREILTGDCCTHTSMYGVPARMAAKMKQMAAAGWMPLLPHWLSDSDYCWNGSLGARCEGPHLSTDKFVYPAYQDSVIRAVSRLFRLDLPSSSALYHTPIRDEWLDAYCRACDDLLAYAGNPHHIDQTPFLIAAAADIPIVVTNSYRDPSTWWCQVSRGRIGPATLIDGRYDPMELCDAPKLNTKETQP